MRRLAARLGIAVPEDSWAALVEEARFETMRRRAAATAPDPADILKDRSRFFRRGTSGAGREVLSADELAHYQRRVESMAAPDVVAWLHHGAAGSALSNPDGRPPSAGHGGERPRRSGPVDDRVRRPLQRVTGMRLFPGSLNVVLDHEYRLPEDRLRLDPVDYGGRVGMNLVPCTIAGLPGFVVRTDQNEAGTG